MIAKNGLITVESRFGVAETVDRLAETVKRAGLLVFARIPMHTGQDGPSSTWQRRLRR